MARYDEWSEALEMDLAQPFDPACVSIKKVEKNGKVVAKIPYVAWHHYAHRLNQLVGGGWTMGQPVHMEVGGRLIIGLPITILGVSRINFGDEDGERDIYGTAATNAFAQALKRTCALFGLGLYMYDKEGRIKSLASGDQPSATETGEAAEDEQVKKIETLLKKKDVAKQQRERLNGRLTAGDLTSEEAQLTIGWLEAQKDA